MKYKISELVSINSKAIKKDYDGLIKYIDTSSVNNGKFDNPRTYSTLHDAPSRARRMASVGDTVISTVRPNMKHIGFISENNNYVYSTGFAVVSPNRKLVDPYYLYLYLSSAFVTKTLQSIGETSTSTYPSIKPNDIGNLSVDIPSMKEQTVVAKRIRLLDEKIKFNNRINDNLATLKTSIFDKLFKNKMSSHLNGNLSNITIITSGKRPKKKFDNKSSVAKYPIVGASKIMGYTDRYLYNESILTTGRVGTHGVIQRFRKPVWVSDNSFVFKTEHEDYLFEILNNWIKYSALNRGSTQPLITQTDLKNIDIYVPTKEEFYHFESVVTPLTDQQFSLISENDNLKKAKAALLSKLF
ncbi:restriction endonuclease subunit S [Limosilactobacillus reuteri]|nr:restriction endonuclease subunit S [Limosilactobacillus reuteri]